ncbi:MAG: D-cysteine desulfhydrase family protein [Anaerolineales bacterium]|jgi:D-cysteine desulfhydrase family pyridoxal phosphate-dependent enzyme
MQQKLNFAHLPTPVEGLPRLSEQLKGPQIFIKRDDQTGLAFGGNKIRKLEYLLADAQSKGAKTLITAGAVQSNHCRQTAAVAARNGFACILVLTGDKPPKPSGNMFLDLLLGAEIVWAGDMNREEVLEQTYDKAGKEGKHPYLIPYGGSNAVGALGYVFAMQELLEQKPGADWLVIPSSSGGTQAGLVLGSRMFGFQGKILGISIDNSTFELTRKVAAIAQQAAQTLGEDYRFSPQDILVNDDYLGGGYGVMGKSEVEAIRLFARSEGMLLDPVYTGRAAAGLIDLIRSNYFTADQNVILWHTGGSPAIFADRYLSELLDFG